MSICEIDNVGNSKVGGDAGNIDFVDYNGVEGIDVNSGNAWKQALE